MYSENQDIDWQHLPPHKIELGKEEGIRKLKLNQT